MTAPLPAGTPRAVEDAALVAGVGRRDARCLESLYARYGTPCYGLARRILGDDGLAQDVVQEVFLALWNQPERFDAGRGPFASWLLALVHHKAVDSVRREQNARRRSSAPDVLDQKPDPAPGVAEEVWTGLRRERVRAALRELPEPQRHALALAYYGGYTQREIAGLTGLPLGTVKTRMLLGMRRLRAALGDPGEGR